MQFEEPSLSERGGESYDSGTDQQHPTRLWGRQGCWGPRDHWGRPVHRPGSTAEDGEKAVSVASNTKALMCVLWWCMVYVACN